MQRVFESLSRSPLRVHGLGVPSVITSVTLWITNGFDIFFFIGLLFNLVVYTALVIKMKKREKYEAELIEKTILHEVTITETRDDNYRW
jgi:uncharacterized membrane protein